MHVKSREAVGEAYEHYLKTMMGKPYIVGWHHCGFIESAPDMPGAISSLRVSPVS